MKRKCIMTAGIMALMMSAAGCNSGQEPVNTATIESLSFNDSPESETAGNDTSIPTDISQENDSNLPTDTPPEVFSISQNAIFIGGKVRSVSQDSFVISRTLIEDSMVTMPEPGSPDEVLVTIRCLDSTTFEHWTIQGGGAGITKKDAAFSDIHAGDGLEASGYFDGDEFIAEKVMIELYE